MKKTLLASALAIAFGLSGQAMASGGHSGGSGGGSGGGTGQAADTGASATVTSNGGPAAAQGSLVNQDSFNDTDSRDQSGQNNSKGDAKSYDTAGVAANNGGWATSTLTNAFNTTKAIATSKLHGSVSHNMIMGLGNKASSFGSADGGRAYGGIGGLGIGGSALSLGAKGGTAVGGDGGDGGAAGVADSGMGGPGPRDAMARGSDGHGGGGGGSQSDGGAGAAGVSGNTGGAGGTGGGTNVGGNGGAGGAATAAAGVGAAGHGGTGGAGGQVYADAGTFNMSNAMWNVGQSAAGIMIATQNSGLSSLVQQSINVQANMSLR